MRHWEFILENDERGRRLERAHQEDPDNEETAGSYVAHLKRTGEHKKAAMVDLLHHGRKLGKSTHALWGPSRRGQGSPSEEDYDNHSKVLRGFNKAAKTVHDAGGNPALGVPAPVPDESPAIQARLAHLDLADHVRHMSNTLHRVRGMELPEEPTGHNHRLVQSQEIGDHLASAIKQRYPNASASVEPIQDGWARVSFQHKANT